MNQIEYENACDDAEIAAWNNGAATPEAPEGEDLIALSKPEKSIIEAKIYVVVQDPGMNSMEEIKAFRGSKMAYERCKDLEQEYPYHNFDVMKRLPDGTLTTEF